MKEPRNEREASRLTQDSGFGRIRKGKLVDWAAPPPRRAEDWDDAAGMRMLSVAIVAAVAIFVIAAYALLYGFVFGGFV